MLEKLLKTRTRLEWLNIDIQNRMPINRIVDSATKVRGEIGDGISLEKNLIRDIDNIISKLLVLTRKDIYQIFDISTMNEFFNEIMYNVRNIIHAINERISWITEGRN